MQKQKVSLLIPCTSKDRPEWSTIKDTYLYNYSIKTFLLTRSLNYVYEIYIGYDDNDRIFSKEDNHKYILDLKKVFENIDFIFVPFKNIEKGYVTKMWNILFNIAYKNNCDYFYQCGDDISFETKDWINDSISILKNNDDIGIAGPINNNNRILTQVMVSRQHMKIFGWFFPEEIINWCCDDWYNIVYKPNHFFPLKNHYCSNNGGKPRYEINNNRDFHINFKEKLQKLRKNTKILANNHKIKIMDFINNKS